MVHWSVKALPRQVAEGSAKAAAGVCIAAGMLSWAHLPGADKVRFAAIVLMACTLVIQATLSALVKFHWIDKTALGNSAAPAEILPPPPPPLPPIVELDKDSIIVESESVEALITDFDERVEIAVQRSVIRDVAKHEGVTISFAPTAAG